MAFQPSIKVCTTGCGTFNISDVTGFYDSATNPSGWGTPNLERTAEDLTAVLSINFTDSSGTTSVLYSEDVAETVQSSIFAEIDFPGVDFTADGVYTVTYTLTSNSVTYATESILPIYCNVKCCIQKLAASLATALCDSCDDSKTKKFKMAYTLYSGLKHISVCHGAAEFLKVLKQIEKICNQSGCGCGCS